MYAQRGRLTFGGQRVGDTMEQILRAGSWLGGGHSAMQTSGGKVVRFFQSRSFCPFSACYFACFLPCWLPLFLASFPHRFACLQIPSLLPCFLWSCRTQKAPQIKWQAKKRSNQWRKLKVEYTCKEANKSKSKHT